jgi:hypothetical protein
MTDPQTAQHISWWAFTPLWVSALFSFGFMIWQIWKYYRAKKRIGVRPESKTNVVEIGEKPASATMPADLLEPEVRRIHEMEIGESGWIYGHSVDVDTDGRAWLNRYGTVEQEKPGITPIWIKREAHGFILTLPSSGNVERYRWKRQSRRYPDCLAVAEIRFERL